MKNLVILLLFVASNLNAQYNWQYNIDTLPKPEIRFKDWNKSFLPIERFENGSELVAICDKGISCKVISYTLLAIDGGFVKSVRVNSNKLDGDALELFKELSLNSHILISDIKVQYSNGIIRKTDNFRIRKVEDEFVQFIKSALDDNPLIENFGVFKSNIRIKLEGNPDSSDYKIVNELVNEIKPLFKTVSIKLVDKSPTFVLDFQQSVFDGVWRVKDTILNPLFPKVNKKHIILKRETNDLKFRKAVITTAIIRNLAQLNHHSNDWEETVILGWNHEENPAQLTQYDKDLIKMLYSSKGQSELKVIKNIPSVKIADNTLLVLALSVLILITFSGIFSHFHFFNILGFPKYKPVKKLIQSLFIIQVPIFLFLLFSINKEFSLKLLMSYELYIGLMACLVTIFLTGRDILINKIKINGLDLIVDLVLVSFSFLISYQIVYFLVIPELLNFGNIEIQWLLIPITVVAFRFYINYSQKRMSAILKEKELELTKQKEISLKSELIALQSRINPHFLYNSLNSIASLIHIDAGKTEKMTLALAKLFRYNINKGSETFSTIEQEIEIVKIYLDVEMVRFSDRLKYIIDVENDLINCKIPVFILQPLVENAIKHGISKLTDNGLIKIKIYSEDTWLVLSVYDNGPDFPADIMTNYGLQSVFDKLSLLYKEHYEVKFINSPEKNIRIKIVR